MSDPRPTLEQLLDEHYRAKGWEPKPPAPPPPPPPGPSVRAIVDALPTLTGAVKSPAAVVENGTASQVVLILRATDGTAAVTTLERFAPYELGGAGTWDSRTVPDGEYSLEVAATLTDGTAVGAVPVRLRVSNTVFGPTPQPPAPTDPAGSVYVSAAANTNGDGSARNPFGTISEAVALGRPVIVQPGVYREAVIVDKTGLKLIGQPGAILTGADHWASGWTRAGTRWYRTYGLSLGSHGQMNTGKELNARNDQVLFDGRPLERVATALQVGPGKFAIENGKLWIGNDPAGGLVEVATRDTWVRGNGTATGVTVRGFRMYGSSTPAQKAALRDGGGSGWSFEDNDLSLSHAYALALQGDRSRATGNRVHDNGHGGACTSPVAGTTPADQYFARNEVFRNNTLGFSPEWEAGGTKFSQVVRFKSERNRFFDNRGPGLWHDIRCIDVESIEDVAYDNDRQGIVIEISGPGRIERPITWNNGREDRRWDVWGSGCMSQNSNGVSILGHVSLWEPSSSTVVQQNRNPSDDGNRTSVAGNLIDGTIEVGARSTAAVHSDVSGRPALQPSANNVVRNTRRFADTASLPADVLERLRAVGAPLTRP